MTIILGMSVKYVPKRERVRPVETSSIAVPYAQKKESLVFMKSEASEHELKRIQDNYLKAKIKSTRNFTYAKSIDWNNREDTYIGYEKSDLMINDERRRRDYEAEDESFMRPSKRRNPDKTTEISEATKLRIWRNDNDVFISSKRRIDAPPMLEWSDPIPTPLIEALIENEFHKPTVVQAQAISLFFSKFDIVGISQPGTGKTIAYVVPMLTQVYDYLQNDGYDPSYGPLGVVLAPTHELANQIFEVIELLGRPLGIRVKSLISGYSINDQAIELIKGFHILVATPGRLKDTLEGRLIVLERCKMIVIDEADKMIDKSLGPQIEIIVSQTNKSRRLLMFSATMADALLPIVEQYFQSLIRLRVGIIGDASETIKQIVHYCDPQDKISLMIEALHSMKSPIIVFTNSRESCEDTAFKIGSAGFRSSMIHGGQTQKEREGVITAIHDGGIDIIVATDILSRGIDIPDVENVINFEMPKYIRDYIHRIGRTGRAGKSGIATSYITHDDASIMYDLRLLLERNNFAVPERLIRNPASSSRMSFDVEDAD